MIEEMIKFLKSTPELASDYHRMDMLLSRMQRLGMKPPHVDGDKGQYLLSKYIEPNFSYWDEDFDEQEPEYKDK